MAIETEEEIVTEEDESTDESTEETTDESLKEENTDYKAIIEAERKAREEAEAKLEQTRAKAKERFQERHGKDDDGGEDKPLTRAELQAILAEERTERSKERQEGEAKAIIKNYASSTEEADAAFIVWKNRIKPTGDLEQDVLFALGGLNARRFVAQSDELKRALRSKINAQKNTATTHRDGATPAEPALTSHDATAIKAAGFTWDGKSWMKKLGSGKTLRKSKDLKKTWLDKA